MNLFWGSAIRRQTGVPRRGSAEGTGAADDGASRPRDATSAMAAHKARLTRRAEGTRRTGGIVDDCRKEAMERVETRLYFTVMVVVRASSKRSVRVLQKNAVTS